MKQLTHGNARHDPRGASSWIGAFICCVVLVAAAQGNSSTWVAVPPGPSRGCVIQLAVAGGTHALRPDEPSQNDTVVARGEPREGVHAELVLKKQSFRPLERIDLTIRFCNENDTPVAIVSRRLPWAYDWELSDEMGNDVPRANSSWGSGFIGSTSTRGIAPGGKFTDSVPLNRYFDLTVPGRYWVRIAAGYLPPGIESYGDAVTSGRLIPIRSGTISFEIEGGASSRGQPTGTEPLLVSTEQDGIRLELEVDRRKCSAFEPMTLLLRVANESGDSLGTSDTKPWITYSLQRTRLLRRTGKDRREFWMIPLPSNLVDRKQTATSDAQAMTRFGQLHPICPHRLTKPLGRGESHEDRIVLNQVLDMTSSGAYEVSVSAKIRRPQSEKDIIQLPPVALELQIEEP